MKKTDSEVWTIIFSLAKLFRYKCAVCHGKCKHGKGWTIHHVKYVKGEKKYSDFQSRLEYYRYLTPLVRKYPKRFRLLHNSCHQAVTRLARWKKPNRKRLIRLANELSY